jgi:hypothetical protein
MPGRVITSDDGSVHRDEDGSIAVTGDDGSTDCCCDPPGWIVAYPCECDECEVCAPCIAYRVVTLPWYEDGVGYTIRTKCGVTGALSACYYIPPQEQTPEPSVGCFECGSTPVSYGFKDCDECCNPPDPPEWVLANLCECEKCKDCDETVQFRVGPDHAPWYEDGEPYIVFIGIMGVCYEVTKQDPAEESYDDVTVVPTPDSPTPFDECEGCCQDKCVQLFEACEGNDEEHQMPGHVSFDCGDPPKYEGNVRYLSTGWPNCWHLTDIVITYEELITNPQWADYRQQSWSPDAFEYDGCDTCCIARWTICPTGTLGGTGDCEAPDEWPPDTIYSRCCGQPSGWKGPDQPVRGGYPGTQSVCYEFESLGDTASNPISDIDSGAAVWEYGCDGNRYDCCDCCEEDSEPTCDFECRCEQAPDYITVSGEYEESTQAGCGDEHDTPCPISGSWTTHWEKVETYPGDCEYQNTDWTPEGTIVQKSLYNFCIGTSCQDPYPQCAHLRILNLGAVHECLSSSVPMIDRLCGEGGGNAGWAEDCTQFDGNSLPGHPLLGECGDDCGPVGSELHECCIGFEQPRNSTMCNCCDADDCPSVNCEKTSTGYCHHSGVSGYGPPIDSICFKKCPPDCYPEPPGGVDPGDVGDTKDIDDWELS